MTTLTGLPPQRTRISDIKVQKAERMREMKDRFGMCGCGSQFDSYWPGGKRPTFYGPDEEYQAWADTQQMICRKCHNFITVKNMREAHQFIMANPIK